MAFKFCFLKQLMSIFSYESCLLYMFMEEEEKEEDDQVAQEAGRERLVLAMSVPAVPARPGRATAADVGGLPEGRIMIVAEGRYGLPTRNLLLSLLAAA